MRRYVIRRLSSILASLFGPFRAAPSRSPVRRREHRARLDLERLEDRLCPATDYWTGAGAAANLANPNDNWSDPANWKAWLAPTPGDTLGFSTGAAAKVANNDYAPGTAFNTLQISGDVVQQRLRHGHDLHLHNHRGRRLHDHR